MSWKGTDPEMKQGLTSLTPGHEGMWMGLEHLLSPNNIYINSPDKVLLPRDMGMTGIKK